MTRTRWILGVLVLALALGGLWLYFARPLPVDMAAYAPANSLVYLESNRPLAVVEALTATEAWRVVAQVAGTQGRQEHSWFEPFVRLTGIGPIQSVILSRAQVAVVITELGTSEENESLKIKPEGALLIETHTSASRIRSQVEQNIQKLAEMTYGRPTMRRTNVDSVEFIEWIAPDGSRRIVAAIVGSLVIVGNSERAVQNCLNVAQQRAPSLKADAELQRMRRQLASDNALTLGYVPPSSSPRLLSVVVPLALGRTSENLEFKRLITAAAAKVFGSLGWSSRPFMKGIQDRYFITLQPSVIARLKQDFTVSSQYSRITQLIPSDAASVTYYRFQNAAGTWQGLKSTVASQLDMLSAVLFSSLLKSALQPYGIDEPESFFAAVTDDLATLRLDQGERSLLIAGVRDRTSLRELLQKKMKLMPRAGGGEVEFFEDAQNELAACLVKEFVVMGSATDVRHFIETAISKSDVGAASSEQMTAFVPLPTSKANIVTYTNDSDRVLGFLSAISAAKNGSREPSVDAAQLVKDLPYAVTETRLGEQGIERTTKSPLGQFSTLLPLLFPEPVNATKSVP